MIAVVPLGLKALLVVSVWSLQLNPSKPVSLGIATVNATATAVATATAIAYATATASTSELYNRNPSCILRRMLPDMLIHIAVRLLCWDNFLKLPQQSTLIAP